MPPVDAETARKNCIEWLRWYQRIHKEEAGSIEALAQLLGVKRPSLSLLLQKGSRRAPAFKTVLAITQVLGIPFETLTSRPPPK